MTISQTPNSTNPADLPYWVTAYFWVDTPNYYNAAVRGFAKEIGVYFPQQAADAQAYNANGPQGFVAFNAADQAVTWAGLRTYESIIDVKFVSSTSATALEQIHFYRATFSADTAGQGFPIRVRDGEATSSGFVAIDPTWTAAGSTSEGHSLSHELMHALGLDHPYEGQLYNIDYRDNGSLYTGLSNSTTDPDHFTATQPGVPAGTVTWQEIAPWDGFQPHILDIAALQYLYGPSKTARTGNDTYKLIEDPHMPNFIWDGVGNDTIDGSTVSAGITLNLNPGTWGFIGTKSDHITDKGQITINYGSTIENILGSRFADTLTGNNAGNRMDGGAGNDRFTLGLGNDTIIGGEGRDTVVLTGLRASYTATTNAAGETVLASATGGAKTLAGVERVLFNNGAEGRAYDTAGGAAGNAMKTLAVTFGQAAATNKEYLGIALHLGEVMGLTRDQVSEVAINAVVGGAGASNTAVVNTLWTNIFGTAPTTTEAQPYVDGLNRGEFTRGALTSVAAELLDARVHITGVASVDFNPYLG